MYITFKTGSSTLQTLCLAMGSLNLCMSSVQSKLHRVFASNYGTTIYLKRLSDTIILRRKACTY